VSGRISAAERAALPVARAALEGRASAYGPADAIVFALGGAGLLQSPEAAAELEAERRSMNEALDGAAKAIAEKDQRIAELEKAEQERGRAEIRTILRRSIGDAEEGDPADRDRAVELRQELADREAEWAEQDAAGAGESL
jgi:hypothetical protein